MKKDTASDLWQSKVPTKSKPLCIACSNKWVTFKQCICLYASTARCCCLPPSLSGLTNDPVHLFGSQVNLKLLLYSMLIQGPPIMTFSLLNLAKVENREEKENCKFTRWRSHCYYWWHSSYIMCLPRLSSNLLFTWQLVDNNYGFIF